MLRQFLVELDRILPADIRRRLTGSLFNISLPLLGSMPITVFNWDCVTSVLCIKKAWLIVTRCGGFSLSQSFAPIVNEPAGIGTSRIPILLVRVCIPAEVGGSEGRGSFGSP